MKSLFQEVRREQNVFSSWRHVKRSALTSGSSDIRGKASEFEHAHQRHLSRLITQLREGRFAFDPVEGVLKDKQKRLAKGKEPRPIAIATIENRIVQRAILQVLQPRTARDLRDPDTRFETIRDERLGKINDVNRSKYGVGGLIYPYGGVRPAIETITRAIDNGGKFFYKSDIKAFFTKIPTERVVEFVRNETGDDELSELFREALKVHLGNAEELVGYTHLFPKGGIGVAQGSSLSAFAGNVLLFDLDQQLNEMNVTSVRYIDDLLIVAKREADLDAAVRHAECTLANLKFGLYAPAEGSDKAARGECCNAFDYLGCTIQPSRCVPSSESIKRLKASVRGTLSESKAAIKEALEGGGKLDVKKSQSATLDSLGRKIYGWQKSFAFCNQTQPFQQLDSYVAKQVAAYYEAVSRNLRKANIERQALALGIPSTLEMHKADAEKNAKSQPSRR